MRTLVKWLIRGVLGLLLFSALLVLTAPFWGPLLFKHGAAVVLSHAGFSEATVSLEGFGLRVLDLKVGRLQYERMAVSEADLMLQYRLSDLLGGRVEKVVVDHPAIEMELPPVSILEGDAESPQKAFTFPESLPVQHFEINDGTLVLSEAERSYTFTVNAQLAADKDLRADLALEGEGVRLDARGDFAWPEVTGRASASATIEKPLEWVKLAERREWFSLPEEFAVSLGSLDLEMSAGLKEKELDDWTLKTRTRKVELSKAGNRMSADRMDLDVQGGGLRVDGLKAQVSDGHLTWSDGAGQLSGLQGSLNLKSLLPAATAGRQVLKFKSIEQGDFKSGSGKVQFSYEVDRSSGPPLKLEIKTAALGGDVRIEVNGKLRASRALDIRMHLQQVDLAQAAALFPQFDGQIEGQASGELALRLEGARLVLLPGSIQLKPDSQGRFEYNRQGWLTQDPELSPEEFVRERDIVNIMKDPIGAQVITELAIRDLSMTEFRLDILGKKTENERAMVRIEGHSMVKDVKVPVVLDVPIRGDVIETINAVLKFNAQM